MTRLWIHTLLLSLRGLPERFSQACRDPRRCPSFSIQPPYTCTLQSNPLHPKENRP